jgi:hypothetical protein
MNAHIWMFYSHNNKRNLDKIFVVSCFICNAVRQLHTNNCTKIYFTNHVDSFMTGKFKINKKNKNLSRKLKKYIQLNF